jgi:hypothetical protein
MALARIRLLVCLMVCAGFVAMRAGVASAATDPVNSWTLYTSGTIYNSDFYATYDGGDPRFRWSSDTAHSSNVQILSCTGGWSPWSGALGIPAHDESYQYFAAQGGGSFLVYTGQCEALGGWSNDGTQSGLDGYLLT